MKNDKTNPAAAPDALQDFTKCPDWGKGGSFIYDPETKTRTRVPAPDEEGAAAETAPGGAIDPPAAETVAPQKKGGTRA